MSVTIPAPDSIFAFSGERLAHKIWKAAGGFVHDGPEFQCLAKKFIALDKAVRRSYHDSFLCKPDVEIIINEVMSDVTCCFRDQGIAFNLNEDDQLAFDKASDAMLFRLTWGNSMSSETSANALLRTIGKLSKERSRL